MLLSTFQCDVYDEMPHHFFILISRDVYFCVVALHACLKPSSPADQNNVVFFFFFFFFFFFLLFFFFFFFANSADRHYEASHQDLRSMPFCFDF